MKAIVTGGAGFIGSNLTDKLLDDGFDVLCIDNESSDGHDSFYWNDKAQNYNLDICDFESISHLFSGVDYVFHLAAESRIMNCIENPLKAVNTNVVGTANVLQASRANGVKRVVYSSTSAAYGKNNTPNVETQLDDCLNPYSVSKVAGEKICSMYTSLYGLQTVILRYFNVYGNRQPTKGQYAPVLGLFISQRLKGEKLTIVGDGSQKRDFTNVIDVVEANIKAALTNMDPAYYGTVFNVGSGTNLSVMDIAMSISDNYTFIDKRPGEMQETLANISKIKSVLKWSPTVKIEDWLLTQKA